MSKVESASLSSEKLAQEITRLNGLLTKSGLGRLKGTKAGAYTIGYVGGQISSYLTTAANLPQGQRSFTNPMFVVYWKLAEKSLQVLQFANQVLPLDGLGLGLLVKAYIDILVSDFMSPAAKTIVLHALGECALLEGVKQTQLWTGSDYAQGLSHLISKAIDSKSGSVRAFDNEIVLDFKTLARFAEEYAREHHSQAQSEEPQSLKQSGGGGPLARSGEHRPLTRSGGGGQVQSQLVVPNDDFVEKYKQAYRSGLQIAKTKGYSDEQTKQFAKTFADLKMQRDVI